MEKPDTAIADYEGPQDAHIGSSGAAINCITVGAAESSRHYNRNTFKYDPNAPPGDPSAIAAFSSRGPTNEFRKKPDVVAPGVAILGAASRGAMGNNNDKTRMSKDDKWMFDTGTSMSIPLVAGCCALLREALAAKGARTTSAALIKALLINGAVDLGRPRAEQGYGRVDVSRSLATIEKGGVSGFADIGFPSPAGKLKVGKSWSVEVALPPHAQSNGNAAGNDIFKATLAYSDRAGHMLQNKLSLRVRFAGGSSADVEKRGSEDNQGLSENNIEQVAYRREGQGHSKAIITVKAERITRLNEPQAFAVVWGVYRGL
ncbi:serine protease AprX [Microdochium nivale]|nr:serine protease AprX [Microdochium nivale]